MKKGIFTLSLDCEGLWGVADHLDENTKAINQESLREVYKYINDVLSYHRIKATYAFTSLFTQEESVILSYKEAIESKITIHDQWYKHIDKMLTSQNFDGWLGREFYLQAKNAGHEIGWHGFSHHPLSENIDENIVRFELEESLKIAQSENQILDSIIFPRNAIGHLSMLSDYGFQCYRQGVIEQSKLYSNKYYRVLDELNVFKNAEKCTHSFKSQINALPAGYFLNWPSGPRKLIPKIITQKRWDNIFSSAEKRKEQAHMWFHPHNMITAPKMRNNFESIIKNVSIKIKNGDLLNLTMKESSEYAK